MDPGHARTLLMEMVRDLQLSDIEYPLICELTAGTRKTLAPTIWYTNESGQCLVKAVVEGRWDSDSKGLGQTDMTLKHRNIRLDYFAVSVEVSSSFEFMTEETRFSGLVHGSFGDPEQLIDSATFLVPNLPNFLGQSRSVETLTRVAKGVARKASHSDFGAMVLKCDAWNITLKRFDQTASSQSDYKGVIYADGQERKSYAAHKEMIDTVALFLSWLCGSPRYPAYVIGESFTDGQKTRDCGFVGDFETPGNPMGISLRTGRMRGVADVFEQFSALTQQPPVSTCVVHAISHYSEASNAGAIASKLAHTHAALTAIARWDREIFRGQFPFVRKLKETISSSGLDETRWFSVASDIDKYRSNSLHVQPSWSHHGDSNEFRVWIEAQQLAEILLAVKLGIPL